MKSVLYILSFVLMLVATVFYMFNPILAPYIFSLATIGLLYVRLSSAYVGNDFRLKRLYTMQAFAGIMYIGVIYFMFIQSTFWVIILLIAAIIETVVAIRMPNKEE